ncbi:xanthine dehydrogenase family protein molybdopterin-binding subunit [Pseudoroseomonas wenyumeiae]|uniref:Xanthine dehydrogenase family protein molybdopterin-binding subunit n=1 Tax=Teichococcus wenyumeiae TaxID=2478470 RepID=A0A3A9JD54_9PROT|nr:molybdopterin cofactor-binding domain-containing protein [Pseudoroseomonas wenyumeiae]RKK01414.1 xanthine dehydrogenase family protein molybdopterin-binding subunit [Pseudoroseomonas wenyumeiae]RMI14730.1 xanthine dehydrogenase family protein molybdopterin-binding subunit [Pseudoroseomonas wenyumeiae]
MSAELSRRGLLGVGGALVLGFTLPLRAQEAGQSATPPAKAPPLPGSLKTTPELDAWLRIDAQGAVTLFTGKVELGQGVRTAVMQIAAEELEVPMERIQLVSGDTGRTPNEGYTAGSQSMQESGTAIRHAAAQVRELLIGRAAGQLGLDAGSLRAEQGAVIAADGRRLSFGELVTGLDLHVKAQPESRLKAPDQFRVMGQPVPRVDIPAKVTGGAAYVQDMRPEGMVHARVVRPPAPGARLALLDSSAAEALPGVLGVVRDGSFLAVVAEREWQAIKAMRALAAGARWEGGPGLPEQRDLFATMRALPTESYSILDKNAPVPGTAKELRATYTRQYQAHGSIGPSCALAQFQDGVMTVWTHSQGVYPLRGALSEMLRMPAEQVRCIHVEGSGCYGHNGADDVAADAVLVARAMPGRPIRLQWMREQEQGWEPLSPAMITEAGGKLDAQGRIINWDYGVWSNTHNTRPGPAGNLLAAQHLAEPFTPATPRPAPQPAGAGDRNAIPLYTFPNAQVMHHFIPQMPLRVSALRGLGAFMNVFSIESFMDELADAAGADPVEFRLRHLEDERGRAVIQLAAEKFGWGKGRPAPGIGHGFGFARYKNYAAYCAVAAEVTVERETGRVRPLRVVAAVDAGQVINPDGLRNQVEGAIIQSTSWTLYESVGFTPNGLTSVDWSTYPMMRFNAVPRQMEVHMIDRPGMPFLGAGETGQGPAAAAIGNAVARAAGQRLRDLPMTREKIKAAIGV